VTISFHEEFDVVVVGFGFAGGTAALAAADRGARVLLIEKMPDPGGISICAGGGMRIARSADDAFAYLKATNAGATPDDVLRVFAEHMTTLGDYIHELAKVCNGKVVERDLPGNYPLPGYQTFRAIEIESIPGFDQHQTYPHARVRRNGVKLFKALEDNVRQRGIEVRLASPAERLLTGEGGEITGIRVRGAEGARNIKARRGVVLACGGFEASPEMQRQYWQFYPVSPAAGLGNTGDGIRMAQAVGADLWHMWHFHGSYGFRLPGHPLGIRIKQLPTWIPGSPVPDIKMPWIVLSKSGRRFMNEYAPYAQDTGQRPLDFFDTITQSFPYVPAHVVLDDAGRKLYPLGNFICNDRSVETYEWSKDNLKEVESGLLRKADSVAELARLLGVAGAVLEDSVARWNAQCDSGQDDEFGRPAVTMMPIRTPPFYCGEVWPVVSNTQGGPVHDSRQRILNPFGEPIPRLYEAGELGSIWGHLYISGGNLAECFITGRIAGREAADCAAWDGA